MADQENIHKGHRQRMIKRYLDHGMDNFRDHEILEILLYSCYTRRNTNDIAHELIRRFGSLDGVMAADYEELMEVEGVGHHAASMLCFIRDFASRYSHENFTGFVLRDSDKVMQFCRGLLCDCKIEVLHVLLLDDAHALIREFRLSRGVTHSVQFDLKKIVEKAIKAQCSNVILVHNHPNGAALASAADVASTRRAATTLRGVGIELLDHIIVCEHETFSMRQARLLPDIWFN